MKEKTIEKIIETPKLIRFFALMAGVCFILLPILLIKPKDYLKTIKHMINIG